MIWKRKLKRIPKIKSVMSPFPYAIDRRHSLGDAAEMMQAHKIRHLPVIDRGKPVGVISARDLSRATKKDRRVEDVAHLEAYVVDLSTPLDRVLFHMAEKHLDAAIVVKKERLVGIFTLTDACKQFADCLQGFFPPGSGNEAA
jgi:acetoin utilization protein AcuB